MAQPKPDSDDELLQDACNVSQRIRERGKDWRTSTLNPPEDEDDVLLVDENGQPDRDGNSGFPYDERGGKEPRKTSKRMLQFQDSDPEDEENLMDNSDLDYDEQPSLHTYFGDFPWLDKPAIIALCRCYANSLAAEVRAQGPRKQ